MSINGCFEYLKRTKRMNPLATLSSNIIIRISIMMNLFCFPARCQSMGR